MRDIARSARSSIGNLYFYFENKDALIRSLLLETRGPVWSWAEAAALGGPTPAARLAIVSYANVMRLLTVDRDLMRLIAMEGAPPALNRSSIDEHLAQLRASISTNYPEYPADQRELAVTAWSGAVRRCLSRVTQGDLVAEPQVVAEFVVRWNLRGLGVPDAEIDAALAYAAEQIAAGFPGEQ